MHNVRVRRPGFYSNHPCISSLQLNNLPNTLPMFYINLLQPFPNCLPPYLHPNKIIYYHQQQWFPSVRGWWWRVWMRLPSAYLIIWLSPILTSVAMVMTDDFRKNGITMSSKLLKPWEYLWRYNTSKTGGSHFGPKELDHYFPRYGAVMSLVTNFDQTCDRSIAWEIVVQFFRAKMWPPGFWCVLSP